MDGYLIKCLVVFLLIACSNITIGSPAPLRIITTSPALTELVFQLGYGNNLVAVSNFSDYPEEAKTIPRIGMLFSPSVENILRYSPDLILIDQLATPTDISDQLNNMRVIQKRISISTVSELFQHSSDLLSQVFHRDQSPMLEEMQSFFKKQIQHSPKKPFSFLIVAWLSPITLIGHATFLSDLIKNYGGKNISPPNLNSPYPQVSLEWLIKNPPEVLFFLSAEKDNSLQLNNNTSKWWPNTKVRIVMLPADQFARTSFTPLKMLPAALKELP